MTIPSIINTTNETLIANIFTNQLNPDIISGNLTVDISDHLPSFLLIQIKSKSSTQKTYFHKRHNLSIDWIETIDNNDANKSSTTS